MFMIIIAIISTLVSFWLGCQIIKRVDDIEKSYWAALPVFILGMAIIPGILFNINTICDCDAVSVDTLWQIYRTLSQMQCSTEITCGLIK